MENDEEIMGGDRMLVLRAEKVAQESPDAFADLHAFGAPVGPGTFGYMAFANPSSSETPVIDEVGIDEDDADGDAAALPMALTLVEPASDETAMADAGAFLFEAP